MSDLIGKSFGRYHILEQLGEGGMAIVYKAYDTRLETDVAVKVIRTDSLPQNAVERALKRFEREAKALAKLNHANIVKVIDYGEYEDSPYLVMPYISGGTLKHKLTGNPVWWQEAVKILLPVARALDYAHRQGMVHRDVKPSNILITDDGDPLLTDFGIAKIIDEEVTLDLTGTSATVGTPEYMAPEQVTSKSVDHRADIYALGVVFYEMVTGRKLYTADTPMAVLFKHASEPLPRPKQFVRDLPDQAEQILFKTLAKKPEDRYQSMAEFANALEALLSEKILPAKPKPAVQSHKPPEKKALVPKVNLHLLGSITVSTLLLVFLIWGGSRLLAKVPSATPENTYTNEPIETRFPPTPALEIGSTLISDKDGMTLMYVPAGNFIMGDKAEDALAECQKISVDCQLDSYKNEEPPHEVYLDAFWIDKTEVTNKMYSLCVLADVCNEPIDKGAATRSNYYGNSDFDNYPVIFVDWNMAKTYCEWAGRRLPTEAQWEKAARGTDGRIYPWGYTGLNNNLLNYNLVIGDTTEVGNYPNGASPYGALDMAGNVGEWVADWYSETYYSSSPASNPLGPDSGQYRVWRGGTWGPDSVFRSTVRVGIFPPNIIAAYLGFRCGLPSNDQTSSTPSQSITTNTFVTTQTLSATPVIPIAYVIQEGDSLESIAQKFNLGPDGSLIIYYANQAAMEENGGVIFVGQTITIPPPGSVLPTTTPIPADLPRGSLVEYRVLPGDTLAGIAMKFNSITENILEENDIEDGNALYVGQVLQIPVNLVPPTATLIPTSTPVTPTDAISVAPYSIGSSLTGNDGMTLLYVPEGEFIMGSDSSGEWDERPAHIVAVDAYWIDQTEITNAMYTRCVDAGACEPPDSTRSSTRESYYGNPEFDNYPVIYVSWNDAEKYCAWAGRRLPSEAEWEKTARGTDERSYPWGNTAPDETLANFNLIVGDTSAVGTYPDGASPYGAYDMAGNIYEWVGDDYWIYPGGKWEPFTSYLRGTKALRGGSWDFGRWLIRTTFRHGENKVVTSNTIGFRCAMSAIP